MPPRIAIPVPHSSDSEYAGRALPQYERAVELAGGEPVRIPLDQSTADVLRVIAHCDGVLLPGSNADIDPSRFHAERSPRTAAADPRRDATDDLLLQDAYKSRKPVLGICYGLQSLNVFRAGSLIQHIPDFLPEEKRTLVDHEAGKKVAVAHTVEIMPASRLAEIVAASNRNKEEHHHAENNGEENDREKNGWKENGRALAARAHGLVIPVNSSHHQSADSIGDGLRIVARCPDDGIIEAIEGTAPDHFVVAVQWHPERSLEEDAASMAIFRALVGAAR
jgi:putative glutamine amidotransferase